MPRYRLFIFIFFIAFISCKSKETGKIESSQNKEILSLGYWNAEDSKNVAFMLTKKMLSDRWRSEYMNVHINMRPILIVGLVQNIGQEQIDKYTLTKEIEKSIIKEDLVRFIQAGNRREILKKELSSENVNDSIEIIIKWGAQMGANFVVNATINSKEEIIKRDKIVNYTTKMELFNCDTKQIIWFDEIITSKKIEKE